MINWPAIQLIFLLLISFISMGVSSGPCTFSYNLGRLIDPANHYDDSKKLYRQFQGIQFRTANVWDGSHGGHRIEILDRDLASYRLASKIARNSQERRPSNLIETIADPKVTGFFGFEHLSKEQYLIPDRLELTGAIQAFNSLPGVKGSGFDIVSKFHDAPSSVNPHDYLAVFAKDGSFPVSVKGHYFIHDITAHAGGAIFLPRKFIEASRQQVSMLLAFESWLAHFEPKIYHEIDFEKIIALESERVDFSQADIMEAKRLSPNGGPYERLESAIDNFTGWKQPPEQFMKALFVRYQNHISDQGMVEKAFQHFHNNVSHHQATDQFPKTSELSVGSLLNQIQFIKDKLKGVLP